MIHTNTPNDNMVPIEEERGLMGSSAADSQLATARSQLRFQSAAFSSSLQTATQTILDQNNKKTPKKKQEKGHF